MLEVILVFGFFMWIISLICKPYEKIIESASSVEEALKYRSKLKWLRWTLSIAAVVIYLGVSIYINPDANYWFQGSGKYVICVLFTYLVTQNGFMKLKGNVSSYSKEEYLEKHSSFALFLRGFNDDVYGADALDVHSKDKFSEVLFMKNLEKYKPTCAIGMTKEADAPFGATRVYVSDESWKEDVHELMEKASLVFILLNDRPSCIWEIEQSESILFKTCFIVEDINKYNSIRAKLTGKISFPDTASMNVDIPFGLRLLDTPVASDSNNNSEEERVSHIAYSFENTEEGYNDLLDSLINYRLNSITGIKNHRSESSAMKVVYRLLAILALFFLNLIFSNLFLESINTKGLVWTIVIIALLYFIEWMLYMVLKVSRKKKKA